jgi:alkanesulfonate monooxygenase SsuD/methylene tetrahydromethanopterin reductase-like flavin-dependent oxidoreductase (luciferase family)
VIKRIARFGSGWIPWGPSAKEVATAIEQMREGVAATGRDPSGIQVVGNLPAVRGSDGKVDIDRSFDAVPTLVAAGVTDIRAGLSAPDDANAAHDYFADVVGKFRAVVGRK